MSLTHVTAVTALLKYLTDCSITVSRPWFHLKGTHAPGSLTTRNHVQNNAIFRIYYV